MQLLSPRYSMNITIALTFSGAGAVCILVMVPYIATVTHQLPLGIITLHLRLVEVLEVCLALDEGDLLHLGVVAGGVAGGEPLVALHHDRLLAQPSLLLTQTTI